MASRFVVLSLATGALSQAFAGAGSAPGTGAVGAGAAGGAGAGAAGAAGAAQPGPSITLPKPQTILPMVLPGIEPQPLVGSVVAAPNAQTTTVALACPAGEPSDACALPPSGVTVTHLSGSIFQASYQAPLAQGKTATVNYACTVTSIASLPAAPTTLPPGLGAPNANAAVCVRTAEADGTSKSTTQTIPVPTMYALLQAVGITTGAEKLAATAGGESSSSSSASGTAGTTAAIVGAAGGAAAATTSSGASASLSSSVSAISSEVSAKTSSIVASATKAAANASATVANATTAGAAQGHSKSAFLVSLVSAAVFGGLVYVL